MNNIYGQVYIITNMKNSKKYIGITTKQEIVEGRYRGSLKNTHNRHLKNSINTYGEENFTVQTLGTACCEEDLMQLEEYYVRYYDTTNPQKGYNKRVGGYGRILSEECARQVGSKSKEWWDNNPQRKENLRNSMLGEKNFLTLKGGHSEESKKKMSTIKKQQLASGQATMTKALEASMSPKAKRNRVIASSKYTFIQLSLQMEEINSFHTLKDVFIYMKDNNIATTATYGGFKLKNTQEKIFNTNTPYEGFYWSKVRKINTTTPR